MKTWLVAPNILKFDLSRLLVSQESVYLRSEERTPTFGSPGHNSSAGCAKGDFDFRKEVVWWMNTVVLIEVVPPRDGRRAVRLAATVSNRIARSV